MPENSGLAMLGTHAYVLIKKLLREKKKGKIQ